MKELTEYQRKQLEYDCKNMLSILEFFETISVTDRSFVKALTNLRDTVGGIF